MTDRIQEHQYNAIQKVSTAADDGKLSASVQGYAGPVYVEVTLDADGKIASLKVGDENFAETPSLGGKAKDEAFTKQFIGKVPPVKLSDIDTITYATITSEAVVNAVNAACAGASAPSEEPAAEYYAGILRLG